LNSRIETVEEQAQAREQVATTPTATVTAPTTTTTTTAAAMTKATMLAEEVEEEDEAGSGTEVVVLAEEGTTTILALPMRMLARVLDKLLQLAEHARMVSRRSTSCHFLIRSTQRSESSQSGF
jgi:hypothetical protein